MVLAQTVKPIGMVRPLGHFQYGPLMWSIDARPDFSQFSTDDRMHSAVEEALSHITIFMHPHIYISEDPTLEEAPFAIEYRAKAVKEKKTLIELPQDASERLMWMTRLDTGSLSGKNNPNC